MRLFGRLVYDIAVPGAVEDTGGEGASIYDVRTKGWRGPIQEEYIQYISLSTRDLGLEQVRGIRDSRCKRSF